MSIATLFRAAAFLFGAILLVSPSWAQSRNGNWWLAQNDRDRTMYMLGFFDGVLYEVGQVIEVLGDPWALMALPKTCDDACRKSRNDQSSETLTTIVKRNVEDFNGITVGQLVDGVNTMYSDYRNRTIKVNDVLRVVILSIKGLNQKFIEERLMELRSQK